MEDYNSARQVVFGKVIRPAQSKSSLSPPARSGSPHFGFVRSLLFLALLVVFCLFSPHTQAQDSPITAAGGMILAG